jgi:hypothetical protein
MKTKFPMIAAFTFFIAMITFQPAQSQQKVSGLKYGKYGCTASKYVGGYYQYTGKGSFTLLKSGTYTYSGLKNLVRAAFRLTKKGIFPSKVDISTAGKQRK